MKVLKVKANTPYLEGRYGKYLRISNQEGVKIYKGQGRVKINLNSPTSQRIIQEATIGVLANSPTKKLVIVQYKGKKYLGILQRHVSSKNSVIYDSDVKRIKQSLKKKLILHSDLHSGNLIKQGRKIIVLDYDPSFAFYIGKKQIYYATKNSLIKGLQK